MMDKVVAQIVSILDAYKGIEEVYLFGSRAAGTASERSDYDIAIRTNGLSDIEFNLLVLHVQEEVWTLCKIDMLHLNNVDNPELLANVYKGVCLLKV
ncbi:nucleotidyltransferase domain-containing protein [Ectobacillus sp. JY-23]|uniref:nucleotidyltransferase domain-containing protein n=1 Tax=Ectobacillus sp. JY-23 TaxID=2933872 RepID=UPI001FF348EC|nr:nucleotidyltransferase domain-containing protein [Ectobacillus sp. JY-23]UOY92446.1 nucleotidyltransferase domain-containing protein [Ectobacillus sp. JY-23]